MYNGKRVTARTYHEDGDQVDPTDGRHFSEVTTDTRELEPHKAQHLDTLKVLIADLYLIYAPLHKQLNLSLGLLSDQEAAHLLSNLTLISAEYNARKVLVVQAVTCDEVEEKVYGSFEPLKAQLQEV